MLSFVTKIILYIIYFNMIRYDMIYDDIIYSIIFSFKLPPPQQMIA